MVTWLKDANKWVLGILATVIAAMILTFTGWVTGGTFKAYDICPKVDRLEKRAVRRDLEEAKEQRNRAVERYYLEQMAKKMGIEPPPNIED